MKAAAEVLQAVTKNREALRRIGVKRLGLFGSTIRGEAGAVSDLDFIVEFEQKSFDAYMDAKLFLEDLFGYRVDLVLADSLKPRLRPNILQEVTYAQGF